MQKTKVGICYSAYINQDCSPKDLSESIQKVHDEFKDQEELNQDFAPKYEDLDLNHNQDNFITDYEWEEDELSTIKETKFKELNEYIEDLYEKQLKS